MQLLLCPVLVVMSLFSTPHEMPSEILVLSFLVALDLTIFIYGMSDDVEYIKYVKV